MTKMQIIVDTTRQEKLEELLRDLVCKIELTEEELRSCTVEICKIYEDPEFRHSYASISRVLESLSPDQRDALSSYVEQIRDSAPDILSEEGWQPEVRAGLQKRLFKLCDHIELECIRLGRIDKVEFIGNKASSELESADEKLGSVEERAEELKNKVSNYHAQSISILGIFSGLVVTVSGALQFTASGLQNLTNISAPKIILFVAVSFFFLFNVVFMMMYCIARISGTSVASNCNNRNCSDCAKCKRQIRRFQKKYPYIFWFDVVAILLCVLAFLYSIDAFSTITDTFKS